MSSKVTAVEPAPRLQQAIVFIGVVIPFVGLIVAIVLLWGRGFSWVELTLLCSMYLATGIGITVGYHRLFTHRAFEASAPVKFALAVLGSMGVQGPLFDWAAMHRKHHEHSDEDGDPHSPNCHGGGIRGVIVGFFHAHLGWMFQADPPDLGKYVRDLRADKTLRVASKLFGVWAALGFVIPAALGLILTGTWFGAFLGFLWGGLVRLFLIHHMTWSINSICHLWGRRPFKSDDKSRNNFLCGVLALGEGWHNNHHAFPSSARHGLRWWEFDFSYLVIRFMEMLGLVWAVRCPTQQGMQAKRAPRKPQASQSEPQAQARGLLAER